jgi:hypothetical protein
MIKLELVDLDELFHSLKYPPIIVNDIDVSMSEEKDKLNTMLYTRYEGDTLDVMPSCDCGELRGQVNSDLRCHSCGSVCASVTEKPFESMLWMKAPTGIETLINPEVWSILTKHLSVTGCNVLEWLCNSLYRPTSVRGQQVADKLQSLNLPRGLNNFYTHFDSIMDNLHANRIIKGSVKAREEFKQFVRENKHLFFTKHLPIPSRLGFIIESTNTGIYADTSMSLALDAIRTISSIKTGITPLRTSRLEAKVVKAISQMAAYYRSFTTGSLGGKQGWLRKHVYGSRLHFTGRAVISSLSENHDYEELHVPWGLAVQLLKIHLSAKLLRRGYSPKQISELFYRYAMNYSPLLDELFTEMIAEAPYKGIPVILQRNPTLQRGSAQQFYITKVKTDPKIYTISMSVLTLRAPNAD